MLGKNKLRYIYLTTSILVLFILGVYAFSIFSNSGSEAILSLTFDDGYLTQYEHAFTLMKHYNLTGTLYMVVNETRFYELEGRELMSLNNVREMYESGWEIGAHSVNHYRLDELSKAELDFEIKYPIDFFKEHNIKINTIAYPYYTFDGRVVEEVKKHYKAARVYGLGREFDIYRLPSKGVEKIHDAREVCNWINKAKENKEWLILTFHSIETEKTRQYDTSVEDFELMLECIIESDIKVKNVDEVILNMKE